MAKGYTYFCTDRNGNVYNRYSASHAMPLYAFACVMRHAGSTKPVHKGNVSYSGTRAGPAAQAAKWNGYVGIRTMSPPGTYTLETEVVEVRAYPGRHKVEPST